MELDFEVQLRGNGWAFEELKDDRTGCGLGAELGPVGEGVLFEVDDTLDLERDLPVGRNVPPADDNVPAGHSDDDRGKQGDPCVPEHPSPPGASGLAGLLGNSFPMAVIVAGLPLEMGTQGFTPLT
jgi:hypothetical protein